VFAYDCRDGDRRLARARGFLIALLRPPTLICLLAAHSALLTRRKLRLRDWALRARGIRDSSRLYYTILEEAVGDSRNPAIDLESSFVSNIPRLKDPARITRACWRMAVIYNESISHPFLRRCVTEEDKPIEETSSVKCPAEEECARSMHPFNGRKRNVTFSRARMRVVT